MKNSAYITISLITGNGHINTAATQLIGVAHGDRLNIFFCNGVLFCHKTDAGGYKLYAGSATKFQVTKALCREISAVISYTRLRQMDIRSTGAVLNDKPVFEIVIRKQILHLSKIHKNGKNGKRTARHRR